MTLLDILVLEDLQDTTLEIEYRAILKEKNKITNCYVGSAVYDGMELISSENEEHKLTDVFQRYEYLKEKSLLVVYNNLGKKTV